MFQQFKDKSSKITQSVGINKNRDSIGKLGLKLNGKIESKSKDILINNTVTLGENPFSIAKDLSA